MSMTFPNNNQPKIVACLHIMYQKEHPKVIRNGVHQTAHPPENLWSRTFDVQHKWDHLSGKYCAKLYQVKLSYESSDMSVLSIWLSEIKGKNLLRFQHFQDLLAYMQTWFQEEETFSPSLFIWIRRSAQHHNSTSIEAVREWYGCCWSTWGNDTHINV